ncbi:hypothetical protein DRE_04256 [Drechslerella stenobrocha 248]|uniref:Small ribosomal subunit protein bS18m n=1 Tax=Drechslerella stenobrocha 248 TaxID=1043628 RepID=W7I309_9PEZI|nr:hypothetical protein DRE_04256 [Drechslerella stenobrocha 248]
MSLRRSTTLLRAAVRDGPVVPLVRPVAPRRLISSSAPNQESVITDIGEQPISPAYLITPYSQLTSLVKNLPQKTTSSLPPIQESTAFPTGSQPPVATAANPPTRLTSSQNAFKSLERVNMYSSLLVDHLQDLVRQRHELESSNRVKVNPEIYRFQTNFVSQSYINPADLSYEEYEKYVQSRRHHVRADIFETLQENPIHHYKNFNLLKDFMTTAGRIKHRSVTGLSNTNQRKVSKAIRRAVGIGLLPSVHRHPFVLMTEQKRELDGFRDRVRPEGRQRPPNHRPEQFL